MFLDRINDIQKKRAWRKKNRHNDTYMANSFNIDKVHVGNYTYGELTVLTYNEKNELRIGHFCSIASGVTFVLSADHYLNHISTFPFKVKVLQCEQYEAISKGDIVVDDDVWIGQNAVVLSGVHIGQGAVIAAGAVVSKDVPPYAIVAGVPAKVIKYRFDNELVEKLIKVNYNTFDKEFIEKNLDKLYTPIYNDSQIEWLNKKE